MDSNEGLTSKTIKRVKISDLKTDGQNANLGTVRGREALEKSLSDLGLGRSILIDKNGVIIAGNKTYEEARRQGFQEVTVIETSGDALVAVKRTDLDLSGGDDEDNRARRLAYADNRVSELDLEWDWKQVSADLANGFNLENLFSKDDICNFEKEVRGLSPDTDLSFDKKIKEQDDTVRIIVFCPLDLLSEVKEKIMNLRRDYKAITIKVEDL